MTLHRLPVDLKLVHKSQYYFNYLWETGCKLEKDGHVFRICTGKIRSLASFFLARLGQNSDV